MPLPLPDIQRSLMDDVYHFLKSDEQLVSVPVFRSRTPLERDEDGHPVAGDSTMVENMIEQALAGISEQNSKAGIALLVMMPDVMDEDSADSPSPIARLEIVIRVIENRLINEGELGTGISATAMGNHVWAMLHYRPIGGRGHPLPAPRVIEENTLPNDQRVADVKLFYPAQGITAPVRCAQPTVTVAGDDITLACTTSGAAIYYTVHEVADMAGYPGSGNPDATLYTVPFTLTPGTWLLRAGAEKTLHSPSWDLCAEVIIPA
jgi:hypothetical protein